MSRQIVVTLPEWTEIKGINNKQFADLLPTYDELLNLIKNGTPIEQEPKTEWVSVSEKLPAFDEDVLVTNGTGIYVGWIDHRDKIWKVDSESEYIMYDIVAWMPLPKPYRERKN